MTMTAGLDNTIRVWFACGWKEEQKSSTFLLQFAPELPYWQLNVRSWQKRQTQSHRASNTNQIFSLTVTLASEVHKNPNVLILFRASSAGRKQSSIETLFFCLSKQEYLKNQCGTEEDVWHRPCWDMTGRFPTTQYHYSLDWDENGASVTTLEWAVQS